uniref:Uncharacterized protein n=1 Tax=Onchocerca volvulus TaxID=6282 RepID=A0A8R1TXW8_ONCVO
MKFPNRKAVGMSREIYALLFNLSTALTVQLQNNALAIDKETIFVAIQNNLEEVSNFHKIMRIVSVVTLTLMGIIATIMFSWNILDYQIIDFVNFPICTAFLSIRNYRQQYECSKIEALSKRAQKRFHLKPRSPESIIQSSNTLTEQENNEKKEKEFGASTSSNISEYSTGLEPKLTDFPTLMPSKSRSSAGQADSLYNKMSLARKHQSRWDEIEIMRHGLINCDCIRTTLPESISATYLVAE